jgi:hypothetical protein
MTVGIFEESAGIVQHVIGEIPLAPEPVRVFLSYAHEDRRHCVGLVDHLTPTADQGLISVWCDDNIIVGDPWHGQIGDALDAAEIFVLLLSAPALSSSYIRANELRPALRRARREPGSLDIMPVLLRACGVEHDPDIDVPQVLRRAEGPIIAGTGDDDAGLAFLAREIRQRALRRRGITEDDLW